LTAGFLDTHQRLSIGEWQLFTGEMMIVAILTVLVVVALLFFAWDKLSAARAIEKNKAWRGFERYWYGDD
jgi:hypothetical protein